MNGGIDIQVTFKQFSVMLMTRRVWVASGWDWGGETTYTLMED